VGWLRRSVPLDHPDFGRAFPCDCIAEELAARRLAGVRGASHMAALQELTFDTFETDAAGNSPEAVRSLGTAFEAARRFAAEPDGWLVLHGGYGCGKTHLAAAIVNERLRRGGPALFVVVPDLLDHLRAAFAPTSEESYDDRFEAVRTAPLLVLDDLGTQAPTPWAAEKLFQILNYRYNAQLPTVITTNQDLEVLDDRLRSRLGHVGFVRPFEIKALDYRGGILPEGVELSSLHYYGEMTFATWDSRAGELPADLTKNLLRAFDLARGFAEEPSGWLVFTGQHGCGKTHLVASAANQRVALGGSALFIVVPDLLDHLRATFSPTSRVQYDKRFEEIRSASLLVLDDLGTESATPWAQEKLYQILNHRYAARLPTMITMACPVKDVHPRLRTRMLDRRRCTVFEILAPAYLGPLARPADRKPRARRG
jgi:DNA replication protein DnaC